MINCMKKKKLIILFLILFILAGTIYWYLSDREYQPAEDEIAVHVQLDTEEDIGLLLYDVYVNGEEVFNGGVSNADRTMIAKDEEEVIALNKEMLNTQDQEIALSIQWKIITEYEDPDYDFDYPEEITKMVEPAVDLDAQFGSSCFITITGSKNSSYQAVVNQQS